MWFKKIIACLLLIKCCYWLAYYDVLFGANAVAYTIPFDVGIIKNIPFLLYGQSGTMAGLWCIIVLIILCVLGLFKKRIFFLSDFFVWLIVLNLHNKIYPTLTGGDYLLNQLLFFSCFISDKHSLPTNSFNQLKAVIHNFGVLAIIIQVCLVYFFSAITKLQDHNWLSGNAVDIISRINHYSLPSFVKHAGSLHPLFVFFNYLVLFYQLFFSVLIWIKKIKKPFLMLGIAMHVYIGLVMGLVSFSLVMIACYIYFWPEEKKV